MLLITIGCSTDDGAITVLGPLSGSAAMHGVKRSEQLCSSLQPQHCSAAPLLDQIRVLSKALATVYSIDIWGERQMLVYRLTQHAGGSPAIPRWGLSSPSTTGIPMLVHP
jgi:hypothetical protein